MPDPDPSSFLTALSATSLSSTSARPFPLEPEALGVMALGALLLATLFAVLRAALLHSVPARVLESTPDDARRRRLRPMLERAESLAASASVYWITCQILFVVFVWVWVGELLGGRGLSPTTMGLALLTTVPLLVGASEYLPSMLRGARSDRFLARALPAFELAQRPLATLILGLEAVRKFLMRVLRIQEQSASTREIVEGLRAVIEDAERDEDLAESEREIIENALSFHDVDVGEVMTPRIDMQAVELEDGVPEVVTRIAETGHTRIPVYDGNLDRVVGVAYAQEILLALSKGELADRSLGSLLRPVLFVPETKLASELLAEFRRGRQKIAVVLDEYGGTAGLVTLGDIVTELVGEMPGELGKARPQAIAPLNDGHFEVLGTTHVSEVNEELDLDLPEEEDFETLAGFVLSEFGRFPRRGESLHWRGIDFVVAEATDRRVIRIEVRPPVPRVAERA